MPGKGNEVAVPDGSNYAALGMRTADLMETIKANIGGQKLSEFDLDRVTIPSGGGIAWTVPTLEGEKALQEIEGVIVYWKDTRAFWKESFESQGGGSPPDCSSPDAERAQGDPGVPTPKDNAGLYVCDACPNAQFGSDPREGSNAQACKLVRQLFVLTPTDLIPIVVSLPPTSVGMAQKYFLRLSRAGVPYYSVITKIGLERAQSSGNIKYSKAVFSLSARLEGEAAGKIAAYAEAMRPAFERTVVQSAADIDGTAAAA